MKASIVDISSACGDKAAMLYAAGARTVIRYYSRDTIRPSKRLALAEARALAKVGLRLAIVHEGRYGDRAENFDRGAGIADARYARTYGAAQIGQPAGSAIYFGVDFDASAAEIKNRVIPYFEGVKNAMSAATGEPEYRIGVYGSGATCTAILDTGLATLAWVAQSKGWSGYSAFVNAKRWALLQRMPVKIAGVECDPNDVGIAHDFGDFDIPQQAQGKPSNSPMKVNARAGLRLRAGPGAEFESSKLLHLGTLVYPMKTSGSWTMVDLQGDGIADGFVSGAYLAEAMTHTQDHVLASFAPGASRIPELVRQGGYAGGLATPTASAIAQPEEKLNAVIDAIDTQLIKDGHPPNTGRMMKDLYNSFSIEGFFGGVAATLAMRGYTFTFDSALGVLVLKGSVGAAAGPIDEKTT